MHPLRPSTLRSREQLQLVAALEAAGHQARACHFAPEGVIIEKRGEGRLPGDAEGWYQVQDEASMLIAHLLDDIVDDGTFRQNDSVARNRAFETTTCPQVDDELRLPPVTMNSGKN